MLIIRLQRTGARNAPDFRIVLAEKHRAASKKVLEVLGQYNPISKKFAIKNPEQLKLWLGRNVELSPTAHNLLVTHKFLDANKKVKAWRPKVKPATEAPAVGEAKPAVESASAEAPASTAPAAPVKTEQTEAAPATQ